MLIYHQITNLIKKKITFTSMGRIQRIERIDNFSVILREPRIALYVPEGSIQSGKGKK